MKYLKLFEEYIDNNIPFHLTSETENDIKYSAIIGGFNYIISFETNSYDNLPPCYSLNFYTKEKDFKRVGIGTPITVLKVVCNVILEFIKYKQPDLIVACAMPEYYPEKKNRGADKRKNMKVELTKRILKGKTDYTLKSGDDGQCGTMLFIYNPSKISDEIIDNKIIDMG